MNKSISEKAYLIGKADDLLSKLEKALEQANMENNSYIDQIYLLRSLCDLEVSKLQKE